MEVTHSLKAWSTRPRVFQKLWPTSDSRGARRPASTFSTVVQKTTSTASSHSLPPPVPALKLHRPVYAQAQAFKTRIAVCDNDGNFLYEDIFRRSLDLSQMIADMLPSQAPHQRIAILCPNGASHVITQWACWMSGHIAVPLNQAQTPAEMEFCLQDSDCSLVISAKSQIDRINDVAQKLGRKLICLDHTWTAHPKKSFEDDALPFPQDPQSEEFYLSHPGALILYSRKYTDKPKAVLFGHNELNHQMLHISQAWDLTEKCSLLHTLPLDTAYGNITSMLTPLSVGGRIVNLSQFDTVKVWSYLLGIGVNCPEPLPKVNMFPSLPGYYGKLLTRYREIFVDKKKKDYVRSTLLKRIRGMFSSMDLVSRDLRKSWHSATGHQIIDCYTKTTTGTVLSGQVPEHQSKIVKHHLLPLRLTETKVVRTLSTGGVDVLDLNCQSRHTVMGELMLKAPGQSKQIKTDSQGFVSTGDKVKVSRGGIEVL
ncbi:hypothetical protein TCAL_01042 [Tigriopus californicus]|uniref:AMP-dependent synthetase/ligase domain-containing protein n=1 Tax=Tigriopus californicus TaxID=6832 RepID=A0A553P469_TIGCA|nr:malonate--CoA ligase ACSF3, mitochondrial-like [Tigriopus californicus]TRY72481.1 hypothetical protein TCAL_01042 [Tigriopus californicus]